MRDDCEMLSWDMQPGDCLVHSGFTIHGAAGNSTPNTRRRALATRWVGDDVVYRVREKAHAELQATGLADGDILPGEQFPQVQAVVA
jgi:ectoine hydroxylase-related dioxygenase (phytanoyl-CoA dioxygenase family)